MKVFTIKDIKIAYRKAKCEAFFESNCPVLDSYIRFEEKLIDRLQILLEKINERSDEINLSPQGQPPCYSVLKKLEDKSPEYRVFGNISPEFQIISSLWISHVGRYIDAKLKNNCFGHRLRRRNQKKEFVNSANATSPLNDHYPSFFRHYVQDYLQWQKEAIESIKKVGRPDLTVVNMDLKAYYHLLDLELFSDKKFIDSLELDTEQIDFHYYFIKLVKKWSFQAFNYLNKLGFQIESLGLSSELSDNVRNSKAVGLPVGLSASKVLANAGLLDFDSFIEETAPVYYGRYVDDLILIFDKRFTDAESLFEEIGLRGRVELKVKSETKYLSVEFPKLGRQLNFSKEKISIKALDKNRGNWVQKVETMLLENTSEWRKLPISSFESRSHQHFKSSIGDKNVGIKSDGDLELEKHKFSVLLRDYEEVSEIYTNKQLNIELEYLIGLCETHIFNGKNFSKNIRYLQRTLRIFLKSDRDEFLRRFFNLIKDQQVHVDAIARDSPGFRLFWSYLSKMVSWTIISSVGTDSKLLDKISKFDSGKMKILDKDLLEIKPLDVFLTDLHLVPLKVIMGDDFIYPSKRWDCFKRKSLEKILVYSKGYKDLYWDPDNFENLIDLFKLAKSRSSKGNHLGFIWSTRPFTLMELSYFHQEWNRKDDSYARFRQYHRLCGLESELFYRFNEELIIQGSGHKSSDSDIVGLVLNPGVKSEQRNPRIAICSLRTEDDSFRASVKGRSDGDSKRLDRIFTLVNNILDDDKSSNPIDYIVFPELSIPRKILRMLTIRLRKRSVNLVCGVEYLLQDGKMLRNQLAYVLALQNDDMIRQVVVLQDKTELAYHEAQEVYRMDGYKTYDKSSDQLSPKFIIQHSSFVFSGLICNEFLDIENRFRLRGAIDALFVVEWNPDVTTYHHLVNSASYDIHCFIIQVNNRKYGDTRIRGPYKDDFRRDIAQVRGGDEDFYVISTLEVDKIREFQSDFISSDKPFKPVPTGFKMSSIRRKLAEGLE